jgi:hypothetical protein
MDVRLIWLAGGIGVLGGICTVSRTGVDLRSTIFSPIPLRPAAGDFLAIVLSIGINIVLTVYMSSWTNGGIRRVDVLPFHFVEVVVLDGVKCIEEVSSVTESVLSDG